MSEFLEWVDIARGLAEVSAETAVRVGKGTLHFLTEQFQYEVPSEHHFEHPVTDRPATYTFPRGSEGESL